MNVVLFGASGMVGQGVLRECLRDPGVERVFAVGRTLAHFPDWISGAGAKFAQVVIPDLRDLYPIETELSEFDACFFCLGVSSLGLSELSYSRVTYDVTVAVARTLAQLDPDMTFVYVSGAGTDSTENGRSMWARVKGRTENALQRLPFRAVYLFRPAAIVPLHGIRSKKGSYRIFYTLARPILPVLKSIFPKAVTTTEQVGRAMLAVARNGYPTPVLETRDINSL
ncbi:MAG: epimerase [Acidobacteriota bacterium]|nr:epimerase [Acidobacteriota bacterium]